MYTKFFSFCFVLVSLKFLVDSCELTWQYLYRVTSLALQQLYLYSREVTLKDQGSKFHSSNHLRWVKLTVGQVEYLQDLSDGWLRISDFHISCIGFIYFRHMNGTFGQVIFTIHLPDGQVHSTRNFEAWIYGKIYRWQNHNKGHSTRDHSVYVPSQ